MTKVVRTERLDNYYQHILEVSRQLSPEEASWVLSRILPHSISHWEGGDPKMRDLLLDDAITLEGRIRKQVEMDE